MHSPPLMKSFDSQVKLGTFTAVLMLNFPNFYLFNFAKKTKQKKKSQWKLSFPVIVYLSFPRCCHKLKSLKSKRIIDFLQEQSLNMT